MEKKYNGTDRRLAYLFEEATHVEVDPIQTAGDPVADITIDGETTRLYSLPGGSGADVEANPVGTPTADLDTIRIGQVIYGLPGGYTYLPVIYSEQEHEIGVWTDGKPLYQKSYIFGNVNQTGDFLLGSTGLSNVQIKGINSVYSTVDQTVTNAISSSDGYVANDDKQRVYILNNTDIRAMLGNSYPVKPINIYVTLQYTKTTDTPGSGTWTPDGEYAHHYSTSEKIVGTWIDGSTLYERTFSSASALTNNSWNLNVCGTSGSGISIKKFDGLLYGSDYSNQMFPASYFRSSSEFSTICSNSTRDDINLLPRIDGIGTLYIDHITLQYTKTI